MEPKTFDLASEYLVETIFVDAVLERFCHEVACREVNVPPTAVIGSEGYESDPRYERYWNYRTMALQKILTGVLTKTQMHFKLDKKA